MESKSCSNVNCKQINPQLLENLTKESNKFKSGIWYLFKSPKRIGRYLGTRLNNTNQPVEHIFIDNKGLRFTILPEYLKTVELNSGLARLLYGK